MKIRYVIRNQEGHYQGYAGTAFFFDSPEDALARAQGGDDIVEVEDENGQCTGRMTPGRVVSRKAPT